MSFMIYQRCMCFMYDVFIAQDFKRWLLQNLKHLRACVSKNRPLTSDVKNESSRYFAHKLH